MKATRYYILIALCMYLTGALAQTRIIDSLQDKLKKSNERFCYRVRIICPGQSIFWI